MFTLLLVLAVLVVIGLILSYIGPLPTPIPKSMARWARNVFRGSYRMTIYRAFLIAVFISIGLALVLGMGMIGSFIAALILTTLLADTVQEWISDLWHARFWRAG